MQITETVSKTLNTTITDIDTNTFNNRRIPVKISSDQSHFIGRKKQLDRFIADINSYSKGAFLITGYRGIGKTRFLQEAIKQVNKGTRKIIPIHFSLGGEKLDIEDVLYDLSIYFEKTFSSFLKWKTKNAIKSSRKTTETLIREKNSILTGKLKQDRVSASHQNKSQHTTTTHSEKANTRQIESLLINIINHFNAKWFNKWINKKKLVFIFDEIDKVGSYKDSNNNQEQVKHRKKEIDQLLGAMKRLFSESKAIFIFIAGKEVLDSYHSEVGNTDALYEHIFQEIYYIPSLLRDTSYSSSTRLSRVVEEYVCYRVSSILPLVENDPLKTDKNLSPLNRLFSDIISNHHDEKINIENDILLLRNFCNFLTFHSWGNFNKLIRLFSSFLRSSDTTEQTNNNFSYWDIYKNIDHTQQCYYLEFGLEALHRITLASNLYTLFYQGLGRQLAKTDDKLVVSSFILYHHILKLHSLSFSTKDIERAAEAISKHHSPQLYTIGETIVNVVLYPFVKSTYSGLYQYRFFHQFQQELIYLSNLDEVDWATFNFSADAYDNVKHYYKTLYKQYSDDQGHINDNQYGFISKAKLQEDIGDISTWNKKYDEAAMYYGGADSSLYHVINPIDRHINYSNFQSLVTIQLKQGFLEEIRNNYSSAQNFYLQLERLIYDFIAIYQNNPETSNPFDLNEYHVLRHCFLARTYLNLKNVNCPIITDKLIPKDIKSLLFTDSSLLMYKLGIANFYASNYTIAIIQFSKAFNDTPDPYTRTLSAIKIAQIITIYICKNIHRDDLLNPLFYDEKNTITDNQNNINKIVTIFSKKDINTIAEKPNNHIKEIENNIQSYYINDVIKILQDCGLELQKLGLHTQASHVYFSAFSTCVIILESIPWVNLESGKNKQYKKINQIEKIKLFFDETMKKAYDANRYSYHGAFTQFYSSFYREYIRTDKDIPTRSNEYETPLDEIKFELHSDRQLINWQYSPLGESMLSMKYWVKRALDWMEANNNQTKIDTSNIIPQAYVLPQGVWPYAMSLWVSGRNDAKDIIYQLKQHHAELTDEVNKQTQSAIKNLALSFTYMKMIADNDRHIILPPLSQITYNIWEVLVAIVRFYQKSGYHYSKAILKTQQFLEPNDTSNFSTSFLSLSYVYELTRHYLQEIILLEKSDSSVRRDLIKNKYYIHNDFEDPTFGMYWTFYHAFITGAKMHQDAMETVMNNIMKERPTKPKDQHKPNKKYQPSTHDKISESSID